MRFLLGSTALVLSLGLGIHLTNPAVAQQIQFACDANNDNVVDATESRLCTDREFDEIAPGETALSEERLLSAMQGREGALPSFSEIDQDGDGQISREEWGALHDQRFGAAAAAKGGTMSADEYSKWRQGGMRAE
jgi:hypothetical protein